MPWKALLMDTPCSSGQDARPNAFVLLLFVAAGIEVLREAMNPGSIPQVVAGGRFAANAAVCSCFLATADK